MAKPDQKRLSYSYLVTRSPKDDEFVATFLELPGLSGLAATVRGAILELNQALDAWRESARDDELPDASFNVPMVIIDRGFLDQEPILESLSEVLPEEMESGDTTGSESALTKTTIHLSKDKQIIQF